MIKLKIIGLPVVFIQIDLPVLFMQTEVQTTHSLKLNQVLFMEKNHTIISIKKSLHYLSITQMLRKVKLANIGKLMNLQHPEYSITIKLIRINKKVYCITLNILNQVSLKIHLKNCLNSIVDRLLARQMHTYLK